MKVRCTLLKAEFEQNFEHISYQGLNISTTFLFFHREDLSEKDAVLILTILDEMFDQHNQ